MEDMIDLDSESPTWVKFVRSRFDALQFHHPCRALLLTERPGVPGDVISGSPAHGAGIEPGGTG